ncbi:MAG: hypothetical protein Q8R70_09910 [Methanoregula sp.]|nr:hypothetical protein [Methanoregula sp.]
MGAAQLSVEKIFKQIFSHSDIEVEPLREVFQMAEESNEISSMTVIGIGVVIFVVFVGAWYLFLR